MRGRAVRRTVTICLVVAAAVTMGATALQAATSGWVRVEHPALRGGGSTVYMRDIVAPDAGSPWLSVGYLVDSDGNRLPSAWSSVDGVAWTRTAMAPTSSPERRDGPYLVARRGSVAVALGERFEGELRPAAWVSSASNVWTALTSPTDPLVTYNGRIMGLDTGPNGFVAVGLEFFSGRSQVTVFTSADGRSWTERSVIEPVDGFRPFGVSAASGRIVLVGDTPFGPESDGRIWVLDEDTSWTRIQSGPLGLDGPGNQILTSIAWNSATGFVAGGSITRGVNEVPGLWRSPDGLTWTRLPEGTPPTGGGNAAVQRIVAVGSGFLASGMSDAGARVWRSTNGISWTAVPPPSSSGTDLLAFAASDGGKLLLVTLGEFGSRLHRRAGSGWVRADTGSAFPRAGSAVELVDVAASRSRVIAIGQDGKGRPLVMDSAASGGTWHRRAFPDKAGRLLAIAADRGTFWAVGWRLVNGRARLAIWTSTNGARWQRRGGTALEPIGVFVDVVSSPAGLVAVAFEPSPRGFVTTAWTLTRAGWRDEGVLGLGDPRAVCTGPHGVLAVATLGGGLQSRVITWTRPIHGAWVREAEPVAGSGASAEGCADARSGTVIVGQDSNGGATVWRRSGPGQPWRELVLAQTAPESFIADVVHDGTAFLATGSFGGRGQADLAVWRSPDGIGWGWLGSLDPVFNEPGFQAGLGITRARQRIVVAGRHGAGNAGLWVGAVGSSGEPGP
jgi:hypothetical protein